jgi:hypothetical protein
MVSGAVDRQLAAGFFESAELPLVGVFGGSAAADAAEISARAPIARTWSIARR